MILSRFFFGLITTALCVSSISAQKIEWSFDFNDNVSAGIKITYLNLVKKIFPDLHLQEKNISGAVAFKSIPFRHLFGKYTNKIYETKLDVGINEALITKNGNEKLLWLIINVTEEKGVNCYDCDIRLLAVYRIKANEAELIDVADIKTNDQSVFAEEHPVLKISPHREAIIIENYTQVSSGEDSYSIVSVDQNGFNVVLNQFILHKILQCDTVLSDLPQFKVLKNSVGNFRNIEILVTTEKNYDTDLEEDVNVKPISSKKFRYVFAWHTDTQKYKAVINPIKKHNAVFKRFKPCE